MKVERFTGPAAEWDAFVRSQPGWTVFHLAAWRDVVRQVFGHDTPWLAARDASGLVGVLPLVLVKSPVFGRFLVSMPWVNYGGPLGSADAVQALAEEAVRLGRLHKVKLTELRSRIEQPSILLPASHRKVTVVLDLPPGDAPALFKGFDAKLRSQVRRPQKEGVTIQWGPAEVAAFYEVFSRHMRDLGTPVLPRTFFDALVGAFGDDVWVATARAGGVPVAAGFGFRWNGEFEMTWASSLYAWNKISPNMLLYWSFLERACNERLTLFNFGRCSVGVGTHKFKRQWGSRDETLWWYQDAAGAAHTPSPDDGAYSWGPRIWRKLPLKVANILGPPVVAGIP
jgi:FemAB-related protein (PEP-CTERM system-associated)